jgi:acyl-CoA synthetase (AMP-forming)/AMP-acid ligase II
MIFRSPHPDVTIPEVPLTSFVLQGVQRLGDKPALIDGPSGRTITYAQLADAIRLAAAGLARRGFQKGDAFAIFSPNIPEYVVAFHAVASLGGITTTINPLYTAGELANQVRDAHAKYLLTIPQLLDKVHEAIVESSVQEVFVFGEAEGATPFAELLKGDGQPPDVQIDPRQDLVTLPYSSGTTGLPKGVMLTHHNLVAELCLLQGVLDSTILTEDDTVLAFLPFFHIYGIVSFLNYALRQGATVVTMPRFDLEGYLQMVQRYGVTIMHLVPPIVLAIAKHPVVANYDLSKVRGALSAAAPLGEPVAQAFVERLGAPVTQAYGMTEVSGASHLGPSEPGKNRPASAGRCVPNIECKVVDVGSGADLGPNEHGEICVRGPIVMKGYLNRPEATAATIDADGWLRTGDIGYVDQDGYFYIVDRAKELIKYKGLQVAPAELEAILLAHPAVADGAVIGIPDEEAGEVPKAFVVPKAEVTAEQLMAYIAERVAPHKKVRAVEFVDQIPKSLTGKVLRRILIEQEREKMRSLG